MTQFWGCRIFSFLVFPSCFSGDISSRSFLMISEKEISFKNVECLKMFWFHLHSWLVACESGESRFGSHCQLELWQHSSLGLASKAAVEKSNAIPIFLLLVICGFPPDARSVPFLSRASQIPCGRALLWMFLFSVHGTQCSLYMAKLSPLVLITLHHTYIKSLPSGGPTQLETYLLEQSLCFLIFFLSFCLLVHFFGTYLKGLFSILPMNDLPFGNYFSKTRRGIKGLEPPTFWLTAECSNQLHHRDPWETVLASK